MTTGQEGIRIYTNESVDIAIAAGIEFCDV